MSQKIFQRPRIELKLDFLAKIDVLKIWVILAVLSWINAGTGMGTRNYCCHNKFFKGP